MNIVNILATNSEHPEPTAVDAALSVMREGGIVAYLTDTLYGLGGDARSLRAIETIFSMKGRAHEKALPIIIGNLQMLNSWVEEIPPSAHKLMNRFWPGPLTLVFRASATVPATLIGHTGKIAIRLPAAALAREISNRLGAPIIATSANPSGEPVASSAQQIAAMFGDALGLILDSGSPINSQPSTLLDVTVHPSKLVRAGAISKSEIIKQIGELDS